MKRNSTDRHRALAKWRAFFIVNSLISGYTTVVLMKFVETHLTKHHLLHAPHKWFLAFLASPVHFCELHYKRKYHLTFSHAKKLFIFDMGLLLSVLILFGATIYWFAYTPTVEHAILLSVNASQERIKSGEYVSYTVEYTNTSNARLVDAILSVQMPEGFLLDETHSDIGSSHRISVNDLLPGASGHSSFSGWFYDIPEEQHSIAAFLYYRQQDRQEPEQRGARILTTLRGSVLEGSIVINDRILANGSVPIQFVLRNTGDKTLEGVRLPLQGAEGLQFDEITIETGHIDEENALLWVVDDLEPGATASLSATLHSSLPREVRQQDIEFTPTLSLGDHDLSQGTTTKIVDVLHPQIDIEAVYDTASPFIASGDTTGISVAIANSSDVALDHLSVTLTLPGNIVDLAYVRSHSNATFTGETVTFTASHNAALESFSPGDRVVLNLPIRIKEAVQSSSPRLQVPVDIVARVTDIPESTFEARASTAPLTIGGNIILSAESRYYTADGDQLGRGPLPAQVGKESKYWAVMRLTNTATKMGNVVLTAALPPYVTFTGKSSVSLGNDLVYDAAGKNVSWSYRSLPPGETVGLFMELAITPVEAQRGTSPVLVNSITVTAHDESTNQDISRSLGRIDISLPHDALGRARGTTVR
ncbi:MAG: hypothetical protein COU35_04035 [Candidatus Magasanikbacteria bacterium CG10_big_fil_rev_8_21_14_0_10_47_10]|uniref:DUF11 domain-containing protein n=1 Tax=Candidatus Magasanikbacteria bacterium CG10_big_fil_rev_8_21_14_0_10_47_10 TaxID=1974652 RepID=A0A2H0TPX1_9BACT|nr:MAG: hypothetical protein COU35_04035 [Candidatus Magasanikbacteria bacterium CG10_big_fil_rev_8_21_14_0_10_47_10]